MEISTFEELTSQLSRHLLSLALPLALELNSQHLPSSALALEL